MAEIIKKTVTAKSDGQKSAVTTETKSLATKSQRTEYLIYFFSGILEILLGFRLVLKLAGANTGSPFVNFIYSFTRPFVLPFEGVFRKATTQGLETTSVLEPSTLIALAVYAVITWGIVNLIQIFSGETQSD